MCLCVCVWVCVKCTHVNSKEEIRENLNVSTAAQQELRRKNLKQKQKEKKRDRKWRFVLYGWKYPRIFCCVLCFQFPDNREERREERETCLMRNAGILVVYHDELECVVELWRTRDAGFTMEISRNSREILLYFCRYFVSFGSCVFSLSLCLFVTWSFVHV